MQRADLMALDTKNKNVFSEYKQNETSFFHARVEQSWELTLNVLSSWWQAWARPGQQASSWRQSLKRIINVSAAERRHAVWKQVSLSLHLIIQATAAESTPPEACPAQQHQQQRERERILKRASKYKGWWNINNNRLCHQERNGL